MPSGTHNFLHAQNAPPGWIAETCSGGRHLDKGRGISYSLSMCLICLDFEKGKLTTREARRALGEMAPQLDPDHLREVESLIEEAEAEEDPSED